MVTAGNLLQITSFLTVWLSELYLTYSLSIAMTQSVLSLATLILLMIAIRKPYYFGRAFIMVLTSNNSSARSFWYCISHLMDDYLLYLWMLSWLSLIFKSYFGDVQLPLMAIQQVNMLLQDHYLLNVSSWVLTSFCFHSRQSSKAFQFQVINLSLFGLTSAEGEYI